MLVSCLLLAQQSVLASRTVPPEPQAKLAASVNAYRQSRSLSPLTLNENLNKAAQAMADDLARTGDLNHVDSQGRQLRSRVEAAGYQNWRRITENLAMGSETSDQTVTMWDESPGHKAALNRSDITEHGVGVAPGPYGTVWVWIGGRR
ncbi:MAG TPA: CAP domain-containing protein [Fimbriimonadaceae bacterium]|nr:CAP domain-containing protein [Armatimonadota bacterium]HCM73445.1 CAP domain-containing protein [Armatimonadota bacterium]HRD31054.1 CAP domain-containing protein [Fimbriimonadaceae bacterium]HRE93444.1 CAP domain-containing protein [Fimbriimonadaceae bacterium]HRI74272.1 CAP domain-containing protein [Fimbriimonadaceae bacterium]